MYAYSKNDFLYVQKKLRWGICLLDDLLILQESDGKIQNLQTDISKAEQQNKLESKNQADEAERVKKEKEKHEKLRKELEAQRLK